MGAPKRIWAWVDDLAGIVGQSDEPETPPNLPAGPNAISPCAEYILATEHARIVAEKDARIAELKDRLRWAHDTLYEINPSNYDHDEVMRLNDASVEVILGIAPLIGERHGKSDEWWSSRAALKGDDNG